MNKGWELGWVRGAFGQHYEVIPLHSEAPALSCVRRGKKHDVTCGDQVRYQRVSDDQGVIEAIEPRQSLLWRADLKRHKLLAANVERVLVVSAGEPTPSVDLISRALVGAEAARIDPILILNKSDLAGPTAQWLPALSYFEGLGYPLVMVHADSAVAQLHALLHGQRSMMIGQSGMGKSTLLNALVPGARAATQAISLALDGGCHTTTATRAYPLPAGGWLIDSPGIQSFGLGYLAPDDLVAYFPEFSPWQGQCRFLNCRHQDEPDCALKAFAEGHPWRSLRLKLLLELRSECQSAPVSGSNRRQQRRRQTPDEEGAP